MGNTSTSYLACGVVVEPGNVLITAYNSLLESGQLSYEHLQSLFLVPGHSQRWQ